MSIAIAFRLKPFSHTPGAACLIPGTYSILQAFPTLVRIYDKNWQSVLQELHLSITGPVQDFTMQQDLEKNCVWVFGRAKEGFYRLKIQVVKKGFELYVDKTPSTGLFSSQGLLVSKQRLFIEKEIPFFLKRPFERLSLGGHKRQNWDLIWPKMDLKEILPILFGLGQKSPPLSTLYRPEELGPFCRAAFSHLLVPRRFDDQYQGLAANTNQEAEPSHLLQQAKEAIRSCFFLQTEKQLCFLPKNQFDSGRMTQIQLEGIGELDFEWAQKTLRRVTLRVQKPGELLFKTSTKLLSYRIRNQLHGRGEIQKFDESLYVEANKTYYLDQFKK